MPTDLTWVLERQHADGSWEAVLSEDRINELASSDPCDERPDMAAALDSAALLCGRDPDLHGLLAGVSREFSEQDRHLLTPGLPRDASDYARENLVSRIHHSQGWLALEAVPRHRNDPAILPAICQRSRVLAWLDRVEMLVAPGSPLPLSAILVGPGEDLGGFHPRLRSLSAHDQITLVARADGLRPVAPQTVRLLVAFVTAGL